MSDGKTVHVILFGAPATFPIGAIVIAAMMHCPVILFFGIYRGGNRYEIYFEKFADEIVLNREHRAEGIQYWTQCYVYCRILYPDLPIGSIFIRSGIDFCGTGIKRSNTLSQAASLRT